MIEKKNETNLSKIIKNINRGRILKIINKIKTQTQNQNINTKPISKTIIKPKSISISKTIPKTKSKSNSNSNSNKIEEYDNLLQKKRNPKIKLMNKEKEICFKRINLLNINKKIIKRKKGFPNPRNDFIELSKDCKPIYEKCGNFYTISEFIEHKCDICNNKNGDSNEYIRWENQLQCFQYIFYIVMEKKFLFKINYSAQNIYNLKIRLSKNINIQKNIKEKNNVRTICKCCFLKFLEHHFIIKYVKSLFMIEPKIEKNNINNTNTNDNSLSPKFQIIKIGRNNT